MPEISIKNKINDEFDGYTKGMLSVCLVQNLDLKSICSKAVDLADTLNQHTMFIGNHFLNEQFQYSFFRFVT